MGLFNDVLVELKLKCCGKISGYWQSKNANITSKSGQTYVVDNSMQKINIADIDEGEIHSWCGNCQTMTRYEIRYGVVRAKISDMMEEFGDIYYDT